MRRQLDSTDRQKDEALDYADKLGLELDLNYRIVDEELVLSSLPLR